MSLSVTYWDFTVLLVKLKYLFCSSFICIVMSFPGIGELKVFLQEGPRRTPLWWMSGNHGDEWHRAELSVGRTHQVFTLLFEATRTYSELGDIAIDDISFFNCTLPGRLQTHQLILSDKSDLKQSDNCNLIHGIQWPKTLVNCPLFLLQGLKNLVKWECLHVRTRCVWSRTECVTTAMTAVMARMKSSVVWQRVIHGLG